jgi:hypothetical protein
MIKLFGFDEVARLLRDFANNIENIAVEPLRQIGMEGERLAKEHMVNQDLGWTPLNADYLKRKTTPVKGKRRKSEKILIASSSYLQAITSVATRKQVFVGVLRGVRNDEGQEIANIARIHEYGSTKRKIPARPLWRVVAQELSGSPVTRRSFITAAYIHFKRKYKFHA